MGVISFDTRDSIVNPRKYLRVSHLGIMKRSLAFAQKSSPREHVLCRHTMETRKLFGMCAFFTVVGGLATLFALLRENLVLAPYYFMEVGIPLLTSAPWSTALRKLTCHFSWVP